MTLQWLFALLIVGSANDDLQKDVEDQMGQCINILSYTQSFYEGLPDFDDDDRRRLANSGGTNLEDEVVMSLEKCMTVVQATDNFYEALEERYEIDAGSPYEDPIILNVGGTPFSTTLATLRSQQGTYFEEMFRNGSTPAYMPDGSFFIDRNPMTMEYLLDYLRTGDLLVESDNANLRWNLLADAEFFKIQGLNEYLQYNSLVGIDLSLREFNWLNAELPGNYTLAGLAFDTAVDGDASATFGARCTSSGPTVTIVENSLGVMFGGFTMKDWYTNAWGSDNDAFVFTLRPTAMKFKVSSASSAMYGHRGNYGPRFGNLAFIISNNCQDNADSYVGDGSYHGLDNFILNDGTSRFRVREYATVRAEEM